MRVSEWRSGVPAGQPVSDQGYVSVTYGAVQATTEGAVCLEIQGEDIWIPKSLIRGDAEDLERGFGVGEVEIPEWFAYREGIS